MLGGKESSSAFSIYYSGVVEKGDLLGSNYVNVKFKVVPGSDQWIPLAQEGKSALDSLTGVTQAGCYSDIQNQVVVWNTPFECAFRTTTLLGWPQLMLTVEAPNIFGKTIRIGYGSVHLPTQPG